MRRTTPALFVLLLLALFWPLPALGEENSSRNQKVTGPEMGLKLGAQWSLMTGPRDPAGEPTLMHGSAFDGWGFVGGPTARFDLVEFGPPKHPFGLVAEIDVLYSHHQAKGFEHNRDTGARRTTILAADIIRIPAIFSLDIPFTEGLGVGFGPEFLFGVRTAAVVEVENVEEPPEPLYTKPVTHLGLTGQLRYDLTLGQTVNIPFDIRASWDPWVKPTTRQRFAGWEDGDNPGRYKVAFDWTVMMMTGIAW